MDFPYTPNENDWHEKALLSELQELSLVHLTQPRWYKRHIFENAKTNKYSRNRRKAEKHAQKRFNVLGDIQDEQIHLEDDDDDDINLSDIDEAQMEKALGSNDVEQWNKEQEEAKIKKTNLMKILNKGKDTKNNDHNNNNGDPNKKGIQIEKKKFVIEREFMTEEEKIKEEMRLQKECNELYFQHVLDRKYEEVEKIINDGAQVDYMNDYGLSSLHVCCSNGDYKMLEFLLGEYKKRELDINASKKGYRYPVYSHALIATMWGNGCTQQFLDTLLAAGAELPAKSRAKRLETEVFKDWHLMVEEMEKKKRLEKARGRRMGKKKKKKGKKKSSKSRSPSSDKKNKKKKKKKDKK